MLTTAPHNEHYTETHAPESVLFLAFALSEKTWKLGCTTGYGQQPRERSIAARHQARLLHEGWPRPNDALVSLQPPQW